MAVPLTGLDAAGFVLFLGATVAYHVGYLWWAHRHPMETVKGKIHLYRRTWVKRVLDGNQQMMAVQGVRNLLMSSSFMASSSLVVIAVVLNFLITGRDTFALPVQNPALFVYQGYLLLLCFAFSFIAHLLAVRYLNLFTILIGADADLIAHAEGIDAVTYLTNLLNRANDRFTYGQRAVYFALPIVAWMFSSVWFILVTLAIAFYLVVHLDFKRWKPPATMAGALKGLE
ncbi:MAG: DUF599 domain-containing protein [Methanobacteriota archaeon]